MKVHFQLFSGIIHIRNILCDPAHEMLILFAKFIAEMSFVFLKFLLCLPPMRLSILHVPYFISLLG